MAAKTHKKESATLRTFIAADFPQEILQRIDKITTYLKSQTPSRSVKWVDTDNLHLTIKFIGELSEEKLPTAKSLIRESLEAFSPFTVSVGGFGMFPHASRPRVIWLGIQDGESLTKIHRSLDKALDEMGVKSDKRDFHPHLTIGRVRRHVDREVVENIGETLSQFKVDTLGSAEIQKFHLYQSELTRQGPIYSSLYAVPLNQV